MKTDPVVVASVVCATLPVGAHIPGLANLSGDIDEHAGGRGGGVDSQPGSFVSDDSGDCGAWCTWCDIDECEGDYTPFQPNVHCGGVSYRSVLGLDIPQVNVASVEGAEVYVDEHFVGLPGLTSTRRSGTAFPVLGLPSDGPDLWNFDHMDSRGSSLISVTSSNPPTPTGAGDCEPGPPVLQDEIRLSVSGSSFAWPVFLGNLGLGPG